MRLSSANPMIDPDLDQLPEDFPEQAGSRRFTSMEDIPHSFASFASTPNAKAIQAHIDELEGKAARADHPVEAEARRGIEREILQHRRLLVDTAEGVATIDSISPRIDLRFLKLRKFQWPYGWLPRFAVFTRESTTCSLNVTSIRSLGRVISSTCSEHLLGQFFQTRWPFQPLPLLKRLLIFLMVGAILAIIGAIAGSLLVHPLAITLYTAYGALVGIGCGGILCLIDALANSDERISITLETQLQGALPDEIRNLLPSLEAEFDEVLLIVQSNDWREQAVSHHQPVTLDMSILVVVRRDDNYWLAAYKLNSQDKKDNSRMFLSILECDPRNHSRVRTLKLSDTAITDAEFSRRIAKLEDPRDLQELYLENTSVTDAGLALVRGLTNLQRLSLERTKITDAGLAHLHDLTRLRWLNLTLAGSKVTHAGLAHLRDLTDLRGLILWCIDITDEGLIQLRNLTNLQKLDLGYAHITDAGLTHLGHFCNLRELGLETCQNLTDAGLRHLGRLTNLEKLDLESMRNVTGVGLVHLVGLSNLKWLSLKYCDRVTSDGLANLSDMTNLQWLSLEGCKTVTDAGLRHLSRLTNLETLLLSVTKITDAGIAHLRDLSSLRDLSLSCKEITDAGLAHLRGLTNLQRLSLQGTKTTDYGLGHLHELTSLQELDLWDTQITDAGLVHLIKLTKLSGLDLRETKITANGLVHLGRLASLRRLNLGGSCITDAWLARLHTLTALRELCLSNIESTENGFAALGKLSNLQELGLWRSKISDAALAHLVGLTKLRKLSLSGSETSETAISSLQEALPQCKISKF